MRFKKTILAIFFCSILFFSSNLAIARIYFYDIYGHWAEDSIMWGANTVKLLNGYVDGSFEPDGNIRRSEYVSLLYRTAKKQGIIKDNDEKVTISSQQLEAESKNEVTKELTKETDALKEGLGYSDIDYGFWAYNDVSKVMSFIDNKDSEIKFLDIFPGDKFLPNEKITREEAAVLTYFFTTPPIDLKNISFSDIDNNYKYYNQIKSMASNGIITGNSDGTFRPTKNITRAEAVTIIKRLFTDMEYQKRSYLKDIKLVKSNDSKKYPIFGDYANRQLDTNDLLYKRAIETLEYKSLVGIIPFEEQHLYDLNPMKTIEELKKNKYSNIIGMNYYLIKYESKTYSNKAQLVDEIFTSYVNGAIINDDELQIIFDEFSELVENTDLILKALERWENISTKEEVSNNALFIRSKAYMLEGKAREAIEFYENINSFDAKIRLMQLLNQSYILISLNDYDSAEKVLREGWEQMKKLESYKSNSKEYDDQLIGALKEVLSLKENKSV